MWPQHTIAVYNQGAGVRRRTRGPRGFSAFGGNVAVIGGGSVDVAVLQRALNAFSDPSWEKLVVDGVMGPKTRARIDDVRRRLGFSRGAYVDTNFLQVLGIAGGAGAVASSGIGTSGTAAGSGLGPGSVANTGTSSAAAAVSSAWGQIASAFGYPSAAASAGLSAALTASPNTAPDYTKWILLGGAAIGVVVLISALKR